jgi:hypothetical protein
MRLNYIRQQPINKDSEGNRIVEATFQILRDDGTRIPPEERFDQQVEKEIRIINTTDENGYFTAEIPFYTGETRKKIFIALHRKFPHDPSKASAVIPLDTIHE